ncbi:hypothetical protein BDK51DRAFT_50717 [Blyttiomyces helicus]|uniref:Uncharacterized protein n=1 Tax=Blyttiomyces helicus TaxID=388810 RepID=A0A4P9WKT1_9FUNG|nr:hypothetical protein BDK51DRAFT_50717 [Blyttiomyces helicus]|eukprot:RKO93611.1 hypothetical protein BDK51DRAFT_50717 [Blyttiomyces helicus]
MSASVPATSASAPSRKRTRLTDARAAFPKELESSVVFPTYASIVGQCEKSHAEIAGRISAEPGAGVERHIVLQLEAAKVKRRKGAGTDRERRTASSSSSPSLRRLHGFMAAQVNHTKGVIFLSYTRMKTDSRLFSEGLLRAVTSAAISAQEKYHPTLPALAHVCVPLWPVPPDSRAADQHSHLASWGERGFVPVDKYCNDRLMDTEFFNEPGVLPELILAQSEIWVATGAELLEWCDYTPSLSKF